jgi:hypothetical protein
MPKFFIVIAMIMPVVLLYTCIFLFVAVPAKSWRARLIWTACLMLIAANTFAISPHWNSLVYENDSVRGRSADQQAAEDTWNSFGQRALWGGALGFVLSFVNIRRGRSFTLES